MIWILVICAGLASGKPYCDAVPQTFASEDACKAEAEKLKVEPICMPLV